MSSYLSKADGVVDARGRVVVTTLRLVCRLAVIAAFVGATLILPAATGAFAGPADTSLRASTSMEADLRASFGWMLSKTASPTSLSLATGESGTVDYTVGATKGTAVLSTTLEGDICVTNTGAVPTQGLSISVRITKPPEKAVLASTDVSVAGHPVLSPGETHCYAYSVDLSDGVVPGATYKSTATVSIENKSGRGGPAEPSATVTLPTTPSTVDNESITVVDTNGSNWLFSEFGAETYSQEFTCDQDGGTHTNTVATAGFISTQATPTPQAQSATVTVVCPSPGLSVTKEAD